MRRYYFIIKSKSSKPLNSNHLFNSKVQQEIINLITKIDNISMKFFG